ncbi:MAG: hypothetical protein IPI12_08750 [Ignavibacteriales bacterium]|nr:hypothetical protein [Ignavibacteriales bacterium]
MPLARTGLDYRYRADLANLYRRLGDLETYKKMMAELEPEALSIIRDNPQILSMDVSTVTILLDYYETVKKLRMPWFLWIFSRNIIPAILMFRRKGDKFNAILTGKVPADTAKKILLKIAFERKRYQEF